MSADSAILVLSQFLRDDAARLKVVAGDFSGFPDADLTASEQRILRDAAAACTAMEESEVTGYAYPMQTTSMLKGLVSQVQNPEIRTGLQAAAASRGAQLGLGRS